jgi:hypothetical protein
MSTISKVQVIDTSTDEVLFECDIADTDQAYDFAAKMEGLGITIDVIVPTITQTLCDSLGISFEEQEAYEDSVFEELNDHDGSCCATPIDNDADKGTLQ